MFDLMQYTNRTPTPDVDLLKVEEFNKLEDLEMKTRKQAFTNQRKTGVAGHTSVLHFKALFVEATQSVLQTLQSKSSP